MKRITTLLGLLVSVVASAQDLTTSAMPPLSAYTLDMKFETLRRNFTEGSNTFVVEYTYSRFGPCTVPATMDGKPHYNATIRVTLNGEKFGNEFTGQVVPDGGCFEDMPGDMVDKARHALPPNLKPIVDYWATNTLYGVTNIGALLSTNELSVTNGWFYATNIAFAVYTNTPIDTNALYRASRDDRWNYGYKEIDMRGVTNLVQLCGKIGHVWAAGLPPKEQANDEQLWRHCILCSARQYHAGEWK